MRKYLKPAMDMEAFDVEDVITVSDPMNHQTLTPDPNTNKDFEEGIDAPIFVNFN